MMNILILSIIFTTVWCLIQYFKHRLEMKKLVIDNDNYLKSCREQDEFAQEIEDSRFTNRIELEAQNWFFEWNSMNLKYPQYELMGYDARNIWFPITNPVGMMLLDYGTGTSKYNEVNLNDLVWDRFIELKNAQLEKEHLGLERVQA